MYEVEASLLRATTSNPAAVWWPSTQIRLVRADLVNMHLLFSISAVVLGGQFWFVCGTSYLHLTFEHLRSVNIYTHTVQNYPQVTL